MSIYMNCSNKSKQNTLLPTITTLLKNQTVKRELNEK